MLHLTLPQLAITFPNIDPVIVQLGPVAIRWYSMAYIAGILLGWLYARRIVANLRLWGGRQAPLSVVDLDDFLLWATIGIVAGGRIGYVLFYDLAKTLAEPASVFAIWQGGMSFHGGLIYEGQGRRSFHAVYRLRIGCRRGLMARSRCRRSEA